MMTPEQQQRHYHTGLITVFLGVLFLSFDALLIRLAGAAAWDVVFWRGGFMAIALLLFIAVRRGAGNLTSFFAVGMPAIFSALLQGAGSAMFVQAINHTSVANTVVLIATAPLFAAIASRLFLRERIHLRTWIACLLVLLGVAMVFSGQFLLAEVLGNLFALFAAMSLGGNLTLLRRYHELPRIPVVAVSGIFMALMAIPFSTPFQLSLESYAVLALMGMVQMPLALILITSGTRYMSSAEVSLFLLMETLLGPVWVWLVLGEGVGVETLVGGSLIVSTLVVHSWLGMRKQ